MRAKLLLRLGALGLLLILVTGLTFFSGLYLGWFYGAVDWSQPAPLEPEEGTIYRVGEMLVRDMHQRKIDYREMEEMPPHLINAFIAIEDSRFYHHRGVDIKGVLRALWVNLTTGEVVQGGSTITQQLARNLFLDHSRTVERKLAEASVAFQLERRFGKDEILEMYLNQIYFGDGNYGIGRAAEAYFETGVSELTLGEAALLAGLVQSPTAYAPVECRELAVKRQEVVLNRMAELNYVTAAKAREARFTDAPDRE